MNNRIKYIFKINIIVCVLTLCLVVFTMTILRWKPCPMCFLQQLSVFIILFLSVLGYFKKKPRSFSLFIQIIILLIIIISMYIAADQIYIQYFANLSITDIGSCEGVDNPFLLNFTKSIIGSVEHCAKISEVIFGYSSSIYRFLFFCFLLIINFISFFMSILTK